MTAIASVWRPQRRDAGRHWPLSRVFAVGAGVGAAIAVATIVLGAVALVRLVDARYVLTDVATPAVLGAQQLSVALLDQETGVRGFGLTGRQEFLEPYRVGRQTEQGASAQLRAVFELGLLADAGPELAAVEQAARLWRAEYVEPVLAGMPAGSEVGLRLFDRVRATLGVLTADLDAQRKVAVDRASVATAFLVWVGVAIAVVLATFLVAAAVGLRRGVLVPVSALTAQVRDVVSGSTDQIVRGTGPRELRELGADVEAMRLRILRDLDDARETNRQLDDRTRDLERSNRDLEQFAYVASHDLQEPLRKVSSFCQLLQRRYGGQLDDRADQYIEFAVDGASRMQRLINDLLAFSRVGRTTEGFVPVPLGEMATAAAASLEAARVDVDGEIVLRDLPTVTGDPGLLRQLLVNLIGNGLKFHREGVPPRVEVSARRVAGTWELTVADNGIGIEPEYADKVFVIFQRLHGRDRYPGTGIGLSLAKKIAEFHDGAIRLDPADGPGTAVRVSLPATDRSEEKPA